MDLLTTPTGVDFERCWAGRTQVMLDGGASVPFIGVDELIADMQAMGRLQDLVNVALLEQARDR